MMMTSAYANKMLKQLDEEKSFYMNKENNSCTYIVAAGEEPVIPDYDYATVAGKIAEIDEKIQTIKHAINVANINNTVAVGDREYSIDTVLVRMTQLNKRKFLLDYMRKQEPMTRREERSYIRGKNPVPEYDCINYDLELIKKEYARISDEIMEMQIALDRYNQTYMFEVDIA